MNACITPAHSCPQPCVFLLQEIPMNFVDPKEYDIPGLVRKNRYKTILPSEYSLPLTWVPLNPEAGLRD